MTFMRNNALIREFKKKLVKAFYELALANTARAVESPELQIARAMLLAGEMIKQQTEVIEQRRQSSPLSSRRPMLSTALLVLQGPSVSVTQQRSSRSLRAFLHKAWRRTGGFFGAMARRIGWDTREKVQAGMLIHKVTSVPTATDKEYIAEQVRITARGLAKIAVMLGVRLVGQLDLFDRAA
jgi:hypothetical protein